MKMVLYAAHKEEMRNAYKVLVAQPEVKLFGRPRRRWDYLSQDVEWIHLTEDRDQWWALVDRVMKLWAP
jgi:hypothetical protein